ncbi:resistance to Pseudomonas syringae protein 5 [Arabidopsis thaliana]|uniref:Disease resistance protein RPS5 n=4 Tax=Arabidopsis thaliana TaxID=3702 RepID=RPS5_ARATH|nr:Disease resistance protein (CC-NBS-LRR class) family [Arabidopsis thaliana]NP_172686.1 Disease resistance protein (CC-NBS-LRR class) family [Arabidopsis thaliana]O64973.2 RecName: Full=Disease resistance protein RPS5; AltName: Full=Resistance to Pseudomonas syringae protein 5; AltName: Full=pNd3/pNd10 [Arabidopsis thaliana]AAC26126.1 resistance to Pseudomonas syringae protein 5 [Arabidopsis thaliana]AAG12572.1 resistance to Pseudomonas syringae protein 5 [Arabidopsis thaliana]AAQ82844.1 At1|eukprot:NP_001184970.1 Disease resistance protein (CC-NBS-LRR class) family [Arabidopsis thaliana]
MGGCFSVSLPCDQVVSQFSQLLCVRGSYIHNLSKNLASLQKAMRMLKARQYDVIRRLETEEFTGRQQRLSQVQVWLTSVLIIQNQFNDLLRSNEVELQRLCLCGFCSKDLKLSYRYGKRVIMMLKEVESLSSQGFFDVVSEATPFADVDEIPFQPTIVGQEIMLEKAWNRLMEDGSGILGLYGMGGVGKTTLLTKINNKFSKIDDRFDVVIWVVVSRSSTVRKIQRDIAEKVGLGGMEWSEKNDNQIAVDIHNVLRRRKFVLLLDDIWEKVNLKAVGVPYPSKDNGCKVAFTTRSRDVCGRMGVDDPMEVSCLQPEESWDLFQMKVGKNTLGSHPDIPGLARKVARKCRGLPLALNVIGEAMACKRTVHEWCHAIDVLTSSAIDFSGMEDEILHVLKYSYDNLNGELMKSCFLYCSLFPEDYLIDKEGLVDYWISEGFINEKEGRERNINQGYEIIGTLVRACLLLEEERNKSNVKMHDVVREMALWISSDLGKQKEKCIVRAGVGLREVPKVKDWNTVRKISLMNNEIEEIFDSHECAALTTLFLQKNDVVKISAEFFRCMPHLVVLDLSENQSLNELPEEISELASLRYFNLSYTCIHQLPVGLWTLKKLIHLNLEHMSSLGSILGISNLWNLRTLGLRDSRLLLDMSLVKELQLLEHLEVITLDISSSLVAEPLLCSQRLVECIKEVDFKYLKEESVRVLTLPTMGNLRKLGIKRCGMREIKIERTTSSSSRNKSPTTPCFSNLSRVFIAKCHGLKDLTWLLFAPNLTFLEVGFSKEVEDIISEEKAEEHSATIVPFRKLETLHLFELRGLKRIYAKALHFPCLKVIHVEKCEKLRKLPLDSKSGIAGEELVIYYGEREWIERVEWEDQATQLRFLPSSRWRWRET